MVQGAFNMVAFIPDQVLGWVGGNVGDKLGRKVEDDGGRFYGAAVMTPGREAAAAVKKASAPTGKPHSDPLKEDK
jgi:hypothetical protein